MTEARKFSRRFLVWSWLAALLSVAFPPIAAVTIPIAIVFAVRRAGRKRREAQVQPTRFVPEYVYNEIPVELRGRM